MSKSFNRLSNINKQVKIAKKTKNVDQVKKLTQKAQKIEALIDNDYLINSMTVESEKEITAFDDMILATIILIYVFG